MKPIEFLNEYFGTHDHIGRHAFDAMLATVRDEARRAALEEAALRAESIGSPATAVLIRQLLQPPRTLGDVLADIQPFVEQVSHVGPRSVAWLGRIARTAVDGLKEYNKAQSFRHTVLDETIRKLLEIK